jgi:hypothetical protein
LRNFGVDICGAQPNWKMGNFAKLEVQRIRDLVGPRALVIGGVSGGVDSTVGATLMREAIGDRFRAILVDNGCMRLDECEQVKENLGNHLGINLTVVDAGELFLDRLAGVTDPEKKRKIIGSTCAFKFYVGRYNESGADNIKVIDVFEKEAIRVRSASTDVLGGSLTGLARSRKKQKTVQTPAKLNGFCRVHSTPMCKSRLSSSVAKPQLI